MCQNFLGDKVVELFSGGLVKNGAYAVYFFCLGRCYPEEIAIMTFKEYNHYTRSFNIIIVLVFNILMLPNV